MRALACLFAIGLATAAPAAARPGHIVEARPSASEEAALQRAIARGTLIYAYDQAAWHGTDAMRALIADPQSVLGGWIVDGPAEAPEIVFFDKDEADPKAVYVAQFRNNRLVSGRLLDPADDRTLSPQRRRMVAALRTASAALVVDRPTRCSDQPFNSVVLPPETPGGPILVYFLTPQTRNDAVPFGGHHLIPVLADGKAGPMRDFTRACYEAPLRAEDGKPPAGLFITHLLDPTPTEIHVFTALAAHLPVFVGTTENGKTWAVNGGDIRLLERDIAR